MLTPPIAKIIDTIDINKPISIILIYLTSDKRPSVFCEVSSPRFLAGVAALHCYVFYLTFLLSRLIRNIETNAPKKLSTQTNKITKKPFPRKPETNQKISPHVGITKLKTKAPKPPAFHARIHESGQAAINMIAEKKCLIAFIIFSVHITSLS